MAYKLGDRVVETTDVTGTGSASLLGAQTNYQAFSAVLTAGDQTYYTIVDNTNNEWEVGIGTYSVGSLSRDTVLESSNGNLKVYFGSGVKDIWIDLPSEGVVQGPASASNNNLVVFDGTTGKILKDAGYAVGAANGVASLDSTGKVPTSQLPAMGDLNYQGAWNASTNTPTLASGVGTKGYYYVVSVAGSTNLDGITDWVAGDWAVFNGTVWQKVDNTQAYPGAGIANSTGTSWGTSYSTTGSGTVVALGTNPTLYNPNIDVIDFDTTYATTLTAGQMGWDGNNTLGLGMIGGNVIQHIGEDQFFYCKATSAITKGQVVMFTGAVGASGVPKGAPATGITDGTYIMGIAAENIANNGFGLVQSFGTLRNVNTSGYADGDILWYDPSVTGGLTKVKPTAPNVKAQMAAVINGGSSGGGTILIRINPGSILGGTDSNAEIGIPTNGQLITYDGQDQYWKNTSLTAGTAISVSTSTTGVLTIANTAPDQVVSLTAGTGISTSGTYPSFTITNTAPDQVVSLTGSGGTTVTGTYPNFTITSSGGFVNPMTTLGDTIYGDTGGTATRLAGNTTTAKQFLSQTGDGTASAAPVWSSLPTALPVLNRSGTTVSVSVGNGLLPVLNRAGGTVNVAVN